MNGAAINSPRSLKACKRLKVRPVDLSIQTIEEFATRIGRMEVVQEKDLKTRYFKYKRE
jgi:hypothetical protein